MSEFESKDRIAGTMNEQQQQQPIGQPNIPDRNYMIEETHNSAVTSFLEKNEVKPGVLAVSSDKFTDVPYKMKLEDGKVVFEPKSNHPSKSFGDMLGKRKFLENVLHTRFCPSIGTTFCLFLDLHEGREDLGKYMALTTKIKDDIIRGAGASGYVNCSNFSEINEDGSLDSTGATKGTMQNEVHEEVIPIDPMGEHILFHFQGEPSDSVEIFGKKFDYDGRKIEIIPCGFPKWLPCSELELDGEKMHGFLDPHSNNGQIVECGIAKIDLTQYPLSLCHSESAAVVQEIDGKKSTIIEERFVKDGGIILMKLDDNLNPTGEFYQLKAGKLVPTRSPDKLSELFTLTVEELPKGIQPDTQIPLSFAVAQERETSAEKFLRQFKPVENQ